MKICNLLFNDLNFEPDALQPCCNIRNTRVPRFTYNGGPVDMAAYRAHIAESLDRLQHDAGLCAGCPEFTEVEEQSLEDPGRYVRFRTVSLNQHRFFCNCRCVYCDLWQGTHKEQPYDVLPALRSLAEQKALQQNAYFSWGGGEPGILRGFEAACGYIRELGFQQYVHTNALRFSPAVANLLRDRSGRVNISLDSSTAPVYEKIKGLDGQRAVLRTLEQYAKAAAGWDGIDLKYIIFNANNAVAEVEGFLQLCLRFGIQSVHYSLDFREVNAGKVTVKTFLAAAYFKSRAKQLGLRCMPFFIDPKQQAGIDELAAQHFADIG